MSTNNGGLPVILAFEIIVNKKPRRFIIDTGCPITFVSSKLTAESGHSPGGANEIITSLDGNQSTIAQMDTLDLSFGAVAIKNHPVMVVDYNLLQLKVGPN